MNVGNGSPPRYLGAPAAQHLLRHLDDPNALRGNPLVGPLFDQGEGSSRVSFEVMNRINALIRACAEQIRGDATAPRESRENRERQYQILVRCDLGREPHAVVAADLALSRRQFYRERREASQSLARFVAEYVQERVARPQALAIDRFTLELSRAKALRLAGEAATSERVLRDLIASDHGFSRRVEPWCGLIDILMNGNRIAEAEHELKQVQIGLEAASGLNRNAAAQSRARIDMQLASYLLFQGRMREAVALDARAEGVVTGMARSLSPEAREFFVATRIRQAVCAIMSGTLERARAGMEEARATLASADDLPLALRINFLVAYGTVKYHVGGGIDESLALVAEALALAQRHGLIELVIEAMSQLSSNAQVRGDHLTGTRYIYEILPVAERFALPAQHGMLLNVAAISETSLGHHADAVRLAARAREILAGNSLESIYSSLAEAQARLSTRAFPQSSQAARAAFAAASAIRSDRLAGTALRLLAESAEGLGRREEAREHIVGAIAALEREGPPFALFQAYQAAARITGDRKYRRSAVELGSALKL
jgi:tetratricopeptide (TPR) repeat protein